MMRLTDPQTAKLYLCHCERKQKHNEISAVNHIEPEILKRSGKLLPERAALMPACYFMLAPKPPIGWRGEKQKTSGFKPRPCRSNGFAVLIHMLNNIQSHDNIKQLIAERRIIGQPAFLDNH